MVGESGANHFVMYALGYCSLCRENALAGGAVVTTHQPLPREEGIFWGGWGSVSSLLADSHP